MMWFLFFISKNSAKLFPESSSCYRLLSVSIISYTSWLASACLPVDHLNAPRPSRCKSLSFAFRRLHHRVLISVPAPSWAHIESPQSRFVCSSAVLPRVCSKPSRYAIAALGIIAPHCVEFFLNAISPPLNPNRVESEPSPLLFRKG